MMQTDKSLNPKDYPSEEEAEGLTDRGDGGLAPEEEAEEVEETPAPPAKKTVKKDPPKEEETEEEEEEETEEEEEEETEEEEGEEEEAEDDKKNQSVPLHVLKKSQQRRREAEKRAQDLEERLADMEGQKSERQKEKFEKLTLRMDELYEQIEDERASGRTKEAARLQKELDGLRDDMTRAEASWHATKHALQQQSLVAYNAMVAELEIVDPRFDENADEFDEDLTDRVAELTEAYEARGAPSVDALRKALHIITGGDPLRDGKRLRQEPAKKKATPRKPNVKKNLEASKQQPPQDREGTKEGLSKIDPTQLSDEDWEALPASTIKQLRGDFPDE